GTNGWFRNPDGRTGGCFYYNTISVTGAVDPYQNTVPRARGVKIADILDGASNTALYAEIKRGTRTADFPHNVNNVAYKTWDMNQAVNDTDATICLTPMTSYYDYTGLQYYRALLWTAWYTHTLPPNYPGMDCVRSVGLDRGHFAARSYHPGGV